MGAVRRVAVALVITAYAAVILVPCGSAARPLSETRVTSYCQCPAHLSHGKAASAPLDLARPPSDEALPAPRPFSIRLTGQQPGLPAEPPWSSFPPYHGPDPTKPSGTATHAADRARSIGPA